MLRRLSSFVRPTVGAWRGVRGLSSGGAADSGAGAGPDLDQPPLPPYTPRQGESLENQKARIVYQSRKRGMLENDLLLSGFCSRYLPTMTPEQVTMFDTLINKPDNDWDIFHWIVGKKETPAEFSNEVMDLLKEWAKNTEMEDRTQMPDLHQ